jgi:hypothetical protein
LPDPIGYVVATRNQASRQWDLDVVGLHGDIADAEAERDALTAETTAAGRGEVHAVCEVIRVGDDDG